MADPLDNRVRFSVWYFVAGFIFLIFLQDFITALHVMPMSYSVFKQAVREHALQNLAIGSDKITGQVTAEFLQKNLPEQKVESDATKPWRDFIVVRVADTQLVADLEANQIKYTGVLDSGFMKNILAWILPFALMLLGWQLIMSRMSGSGGGGGMLSFGKNKARVYIDKDIKVSFNDIAGIDEAVDELREVVSFLREPDHYTKLGGRLPKGVLLVGPPGTGKTLLARAVAGEAKVPFFSLSGSEFVEMFVGVGAARVRDLFNQAQQNAPCIIFIDELDAMGRARGVNMMGSNEEREQTLNQLLTEMDGFDPNKGVILMAATNRPEILDPALLRAGRFDRHVLVDRPDVKGRAAILRIHTRKVRLAEGVDIEVLASRTPGFVGADLENIVNEAALLAARANKESVAMADFEEAIDRVLTGLRKKSTLMTPDEKHRVAVHESGHAIAAMQLQHVDPVHKVSIIPRGIGALGFTLQLPAQDRHLYTQQELLERIQVLLGGRAAEQITFDDLSTGAADDLQKATEMARRLVVEFGMSECLGPMAVPVERSVFLAEVQEKMGNISDATALRIDTEVQHILQSAYDSVCSLLRNRTAALRQVADLLETKETIEGEEVKAILARASD